MIRLCYTVPFEEERCLEDDWRLITRELRRIILLSLSVLRRLGLAPERETTFCLMSLLLSFWSFYFSTVNFFELLSSARRLDRSPPVLLSKIFGRFLAELWDIRTSLLWFVRSADVTVRCILRSSCSILFYNFSFYYIMLYFCACEMPVETI